MSTGVIPEMDAALRRRVAEAMSPSERLTPSEWCPRERRLKPGTTEDPGPMRPWPWQAEFMDAPVDYPSKEGVVMMKATQMGISEAALSVVGWWADQRPSPILYLMPTDSKAKEFEKDRISWMIRKSPSLREKFFLGKQQGETKASKEFHGGRLRLYGHGSSSKLQSDPYALVVPDELDAMADFPGEGSAWSMSRQRTKRFTQSWIMAMSKPTLEKAGVSAIWENETDCRRFHVPCPHCGEMEWLKFSQVTWENRDPRTAAYLCEHCGSEITDAERRQIIHEGTYLSTLDEDEAARRPFVGMHISALYDPKQSIEALSREWLGCHSEGEKQIFINEELGEPYTPSEQMLKEEDVRNKGAIRPDEKAPASIRFVTAGVDVQKGDRFFIDISGWSARQGRKYLWRWETVQGWDRLLDFVENVTVETEDRELQVACLCIDSQYGEKTTQVYQFCNRHPSWLVPVRYGPTGDGEFARVKENTRYGLSLHFLDRGYWMSRVLGRFQGQEDVAGVVIRGTPDRAYINHMLAPRARTKQGKYGEVRTVFETPDDEQDDWFHAGVCCEYAAVLMGLDRIKNQAEQSYIPADRAKREKMAAEEGKTVEEFIRDRKQKGGFVARTARKGFS